jgi:hypothetical protein
MSGLVLLVLAFLWLAVDYRLVGLAARRLPAEWAATLALSRRNHRRSSKIQRSQIERPRGSP